MTQFINTRLITIFVAVLTLSGCAHKRLIDDGEQHQQTGRYEQAVKSYQQALNIKPNDQKTQQKLAIAQQALDVWLDRLTVAALQAKNQNLPGRAMLLYSKVAQLRADQNAIQNYKALHQQILKQSRYHLFAQGPSQFGQQFAARIADVVITNNQNANSNNHFELSATISEPQFNTSSDSKTVTQSYISGYETVANPEFHALQDNIANNRDQLEHYQADYNIKLSGADHAHLQLVAVEKDLEIARLRLNQANPNTSNYNYWRNEINRLSHIADDKKHHYDDIRSQLDAINHRIEETRHEVDNNLNELSYIQPTVEQPVHAEHHYEVQQVTRTATGKLHVRFSADNNSLFANKSLRRSKTITAHDSDEGHQEQPLLNLSFNDINLQSDQQISRQFYANGKEQARIAIKQHLNDYRGHLREQANQVAGIDEQLEAGVIYGLSGSDGVDRPTATNMKNQLRQEFGIAGEFEINKLLYLFD